MALSANDIRGREEGNFSSRNECFNNSEGFGRSFTVVNMEFNKLIKLDGVFSRICIDEGFHFAFSMINEVPKII
jgi:hypothetical protein